MPMVAINTTAGNRAMITVFEHLQAMGVTITAMALAGNTLAITFSRPLTADELSHMGLS